MTNQSNHLDFEVNGGKILSGKITTNTSKNGALGLLAASLLNKGTTLLKGIPKIEEVNRILEVLESINVKYEWQGDKDILINASDIKIENINYESASKTRAIIMFIGPLIHRFKNFKLPNSQGCKLGKRSVNTHLYALKKLGVNIKVLDFTYEINHSELKPSEIVMFEAGDTPVENVLMAAALIPGKTTIKYASANYMVQDVCFLLEKFGVKIKGIGTQTLEVEGVEDINLNIEHNNSQDPIDAMMYLSAGICTRSNITIQKAPIDFLELELLKLELMGLKYKMSDKYLSENGKTKLVDIEIFPSDLKALEDKITCGAYPDLNIDNLPFFVPIACMAKGTTLIHDWVFENRAIYFTELTRLGANIKLADPHRVYIDGKIDFKPAQVVSPSAIRPAMIILISMLAAPGKSIFRNIYSIKRGYEDVSQSLNSLGADIKLI